MTDREKEIALRRELGRRDFFWFVNTLVYGHLGDSNKICPREDGPHNRIASFYQRTEVGGPEYITRTLLLAPRGYYKTSVCVVGYVLWVLARNPNARILLISAAEDLSQKTLGQIKNHCESNAWLLTIFPHLGPKDTRRDWAVSKMKIAGFTRMDAKESSVEAKGIGGKLAGNHYTHIICDDVVGEANVNTPEQLWKVIEYVDKLTPVLENSGRGSQLRVVGTRWHQQDLYGEIMMKVDQAKKSGGTEPFRVLKFGVFDDEGESVWPEEYSKEDLNELRATMTPQNWANQYLNEVIAREDQLVDIERVRQFYVDELPDGWRDWDAFASLDPSMGTYRDHSALVSWVMDPKTGIPYVFDIFDAKVKPDELFKALYTRHEAYDYKVIYFEMQINEALWLDKLRREGAARGSYLPAIPVRRKGTKSGNKESRIYALGNFINNGHIRFWSRCAQLGDFEDQASTWPRSPLDDLLDAMAEIVPNTPIRTKRNDADADRDRNRLPEEYIRLFEGGGAKDHFPEGWVVA